MATASSGIEGGSSASGVIAALLAEAVRRHRRAVGILVHDVPGIEPEPVLQALARLEEEGIAIRVAYLDQEAERFAKGAGIPPSSFSTSVEQAERWRNQRGLSACIVVITRGAEDKISSLAEFVGISSRDLKHLLAARALRDRGPASANDVQGRWWSMLQRDKRVSFSQLLNYYLAIDGCEASEALVRASEGLHHLGLLPDPAFFNEPAEAALRRRLELNRELVERLQTFTDKDRKTAQRNLAAVTSKTERAELSRSLRQLKDLRATGHGLSQLTVRAAQRLIDARRRPVPSVKPTEPSPSPDPKPTRCSLAEVAADALVGAAEDRTALDAIVSDVAEQLNVIDAQQLKPEAVGASLGSGVEVAAQARGDIVNLVAKLIDDGVYGGLILGSDEDADVDAMIRRFHSQDTLLRRWTREEIQQYLTGVSEPDVLALGKLFDAYDQARAAVLPLVRLICADPMTAAVAPSTSGALSQFVDAYRELLAGVDKFHGALAASLGADAQDFLAHILLLETIAFRRESGDLVTLLAPTHPLFLWHFTEYVRVVTAQRDRLSEADRELVADAATRPPYFLTSLYMPAAVADTPQMLVELGRLGPLPMYGRGVQSNTSADGYEVVKTLLRAFIDIHPSARRGLRVAFIGAPDVGALLAMMCDLGEAGAVEGAHVVAVSQGPLAVPPDLRLAAHDEERIARMFRATGASRRFTYETQTVPSGSLELPEDTAYHLVVTFDQSDGQSSQAATATHPIQPLAVSYKLQYRRTFGTLELVPAPGGIFAAYNQMVGHAGGTPQPSYFSIHQSAKLRAAMQAAATQSVWYVVADRHVDRDLELAGLRVFSGREGERDVVAFAAATDAFRRALRDVARQFNTAISDAELDDLLRELSNLLDTGVLALRPDTATGRVNATRIKGLLGTLIAVRHFKRDAQPGHERLILSLDSAQARRWLHLSDDPQRADLVGFDFGADRLTITVIEVKTVQDAAAEYSIRDGIASGSAVDQVLSTRKLLAQVFAGDREGELITTPARRELLREHAFRELTKPTYDAAVRRAWADRLERLFAGDVPAQVACELVEVRLGVDSGSLEQRDARAESGGELVHLRVTQLNEAGVDALRQKAAETPPESDENDGGSGATSTPGTPPSDSPTERDTSPAADSPTLLSVEQTAGAQPIRAPANAPASDSDAAVRPRALIGEASGAYGRAREVWFDPQLPSRPLPNPHMMVTGETGSGKTQAVKAVLRDLRKSSVPALVLDFKDDYSQTDYATAEAMNVSDASLGGLPFNPMTPAVDPQTGRVAILNHIHAFSEIVKRIYTLGDQQTYRFREALKELYQGAGISLQPFVPSNTQRFPAFDDLRSTLEQKKENDALLGRLSPIFDLQLFGADDGKSFASVVDGSSVIRLSQLPGDESKNAVAEFFLMALYNHCIRLPHPHVLQRVLVLDEAWRLVKSPFLEPLMREGRAFGLGVFIATQFPQDLPDHVAGSTATKLFFSQTRSEHVRDVQRALVGKTTGADAEHMAAAIRELPPLTCFVQNNQNAAVRTSVLPYFERARDIA